MPERPIERKLVAILAADMVGFSRRTAIHAAVAKISVEIYLRRFEDQTRRRLSSVMGGFEQKLWRSGTTGLRTRAQYKSGPHPPCQKEYRSRQATRGYRLGTKKSRR
jgi:hypothetical protein